MKTFLTKYSDSDCAHVVMIPQSKSDHDLLEIGDSSVIASISRELIESFYPGHVIMNIEPLDNEKQYYLFDLRRRTAA